MLIISLTLKSLKRHTLKLPNQISAGGTYDTIFEIPSAENIFEKSAVILTPDKAIVNSSLKRSFIVLYGANID